jgi:hypothetical protein
MNLGKLLGAGNSFFGGGQPLAYRLNGLALPKFNAERNPFTPKAPEEKTPAKNMENTFSAPANAVAPAKVAVPVVTPGVVAPKVVVPKPAAPLVAAKPVRAGWTAKLNPFRTPEPEKARPVAVQPELSLDAVKVVHNDLSDADVEIVPVKSHAAAPAPVLPPARRAWEYLGESVVK